MVGLLPVLGAIGGGGVLLSAGYAAARYLADKWITAKFHERLEAFKHAQQREVEALRFEISGLLDRAVKLHTQEFDALPELWSRLNKAFWEVSALVASMQSHPDLDKMSDAELSDFLDKVELDGWEKQEVLDAAEKTDKYAEHKFWHDYHRANKTFVKFNRYFGVKSIFLGEDVKVKVREMQALMRGALIERTHEQRYPHPRDGRWVKREALEDNGEAVLRGIESAIKARLWDAVKMPERQADASEAA